MVVTPLGARLEAERARRDVTLTEFARDVLGISHSLVSRYINGRQLPSSRTARQIRERLGIDRDEFEALLAGSEVPRAESSGDLLQTAGRSGVIMSPTATIRIDDPRVLGHFYGFLSRWERMTEEERDSLTQDDVDIPDPEADRGEGDARGGGGSPRGPA